MSNSSANSTDWLLWEDNTPEPTRLSPGQKIYRHSGAVRNVMNTDHPYLQVVTLNYSGRYEARTVCNGLAVGRTTQHASLEAAKAQFTEPLGTVAQ